MEINFKEFFAHLAKRWWIIAIAILTGFIIAFLSSTFLVDKKYQSRVVFAYEERDAKELSIDKKFVERSVAAVKENVYLSKLKDYLKENNSPSNPNLSADRKLSALVDIDNEAFDIKLFRDALKTDYNSLTLTLEFKVITADANDSYLIAEAMTSKKMLEELSGIIGIGGMQYARFIIMAQPELDEQPVSPNTALNSIIGLFLGLAAGVVISLLIEKLDVRIKGERDLIEKYDLPILGMIPSFVSAEEVHK